MSVAINMIESAVGFIDQGRVPEARASLLVLADALRKEQSQKQEDPPRRKTGTTDKSRFYSSRGYENKDPRWFHMTGPRRGKFNEAGERHIFQLMDEGKDDDFLIHYFKITPGSVKHRRMAWMKLRGKVAA